MSLASGTTLGPYQVTAPLGAGGMGEVYRATDTDLGRQVALKVLPSSVAADAERLARFEREAKTLAALNHPNIAAIYGLERDGRTTALVMELVDGPTLADRIAHGAMPLDEALPIATQIAEALAAAHDQGIVHRDLKPANIKVRPDGTVKVLDFGLAKSVDPAGASTAGGAGASLSPTITSPALTQMGVLLGTAAYMSPEQARGRAVDKRADIWAFGCVLYEMVTGHRAFGGDDVTETIAAVMRDQPALDQVPAQWRRLVARCLEKDPRRRLRDIGDVWAFADEPARLPAAPATSVWQWILPWSVAAAAIAGAAVVSIAHFSESPPLPGELRFQIEVPVEAGTSIPTLSPDGRRLAYRARGQVWLRDLASLEARPLAPIDQPVGRVFWTADSRFVLYGADKKLMQVPAEGGPAQALSDLEDGVLAGGVALPDGSLLIGQTQAGAFRVSSDGAQRLQQDFGRSWLRGGVSLLPDGKRIVYSVSDPEASRGIYVVPIDGSAEPTRLLPDSSEVAYVPSARDDSMGYLLILRQNRLVALPVGADALEPRGEATEIAAGVAAFAASPTGAIVYRAARDGRLTWYDRQGMQSATVGAPGPYVELALSPDDARVAFVRADGPTVSVHEFAREATTRLTASGVAIKPLWSPGGRIVILTGVGGQSQRARVVSVAPDGSGPEQTVLTASTVLYPTSWSRDGKWLLYTNVDPRTKEDLWVVPMTMESAGTPEPFLVTDNQETDATFAPDGRSVAYVSNESGTSNVYVRGFPSTSGRKWQVSTAGGYQPRWRGDGRELLYMSPDGQLMSVDVPADAAAAPARPRLLFQTAVFGGGATLNNWYWDVTRDGQRFLINTVSGAAERGALNVIVNWQSGLER